MESKNVQLIIEDCLNEDEERLIKKIANIKYKLPIINSLVIEIEECNLNKLKKLKFIKQVYENTNITMQMNTARNVVNAHIVQEKGYTGKGIGVAILDTGISPVNDFTKPINRIVAFKDFVNNKSKPYDDNGHGTHVAGITGGNGINSNGKYKGIAPDCNLIAVKVLDEAGQGNAGETDIIGLN